MKLEKGLPLINIGFGNVPGSSPLKRLREEAAEKGKLIDATQGRKTRAIIVTDSDHILLSSLQMETLTQRFLQEKKND
jgi:regulator of extracellular matrix RemA (YlzA/DUF370 family)